MDNLLATALVGRGPPRDLLPAEAAAFSAVMDTFIAPASSSPDLPPTLAALRASDHADATAVYAKARTVLPAVSVRKLLMVLHLLARPAGMWVLSGAKHARPFAELSSEERERVVVGWMTSANNLNRTLYSLFKSLTMIHVYGTFASPQTHPVARELGYDPVPPPPPAAVPVPDLSFIPRPVPSTLSCDVVIVGSGAGGGVAAAVLASRGYRVLVVEKGDWVPHPTGDALAGTEQMYDMAGLMSSADASIALLAGSTVGGGTAVNWSASLKPQHWLREEWAADHGLPYFTSPEYTRALDAVCDRIGVSESGIAHNRVNALFADGCKKLGMHVADIPQNTRGDPHACANCGFGCAAGTKQSSARTWLADACKAGARILAGARVDRVLVSPAGTATGVAARLVESGQIVTITARRVVVACGSIQSPALLLRSGLANPHLGRHLGLHPVGLVLGRFPDPVHMHQGSMMTAVSNAVESYNAGQARPTGSAAPRAYGAKLECTTLTPMYASTLLPWTGSDAHKALMRDFDHYAPVLSLTRDRDRRARVVLDADGEPSVEFGMSGFDERNLVEGLVRAAMVLLAAGATRVVTTQCGVPPFDITPGSEWSPACPRWQAWEKEVRRVGCKPLHSPLFSAHQMGTCRMGSSPKRSVVNPRGEAWEVKGLYVADASTFPTSSGVNPMVTTYAMGYSVANFIADDDPERKAAKL
ncbi:hypothetical protein H9P43_007392 [Blastocladiella emersonii ATCC 22665]|nr:hypothetical protein H9P43_007392 [Blastocladiella emersonii ATCC 22665]